MLGYRQNSGRIGKTAFDRVLTTVKGGDIFKTGNFIHRIVNCSPKLGRLNRDYAAMGWIRKSPEIGPFNQTRRLLVFQWTT